MEPGDWNVVTEFWQHFADGNVKTEKKEDPMEPQEVIDLGREAIKTCLIVGGPILLASLIVGMVVGAVQAMTQIPDQSVSFVPKVLCLILVVGLALPWLTDRMLDYSREAFSKPFFVQTQANPVRTIQFNRTGNPPPMQQPSPSTASEPAPVEPDKSPFHLPKYRFSRLPKPNLEG
jgi:flagellar biosynthesis protein FliQ